MLLWMLAGLAWLQLLTALAALGFAVPDLLSRLIAIASLALLVIAVWRRVWAGIEWDDQASVLWLAGLGMETAVSALVRRKAVGSKAAAVPNQ